MIFLDIVHIKNSLTYRDISDFVIWNKTLCVI